MRIALCLYGQIDGEQKNWTNKTIKNTWRKTAPNIKKFIIEHLQHQNHTVDVFLHAFGTSQANFKELVNFYTPTQHQCQINNIVHSNILVKNLTCCLHTITSSLKLALNKQNYDVYVSCRYDFLPQSPLDLTKCLNLDKNIYMLYNGQDMHLKWGNPNNHVIVGDEEFMKLYSNIPIPTEKASIHKLMILHFAKTRVYKKLAIKGYVDKYPYNTLKC